MKIRKNRRKYNFRYLQKGALELCRAATIQPRQIEHSVFFSNGPQWTNSSLQTGLRSIIYGWFHRNRDSLAENDDPPAPHAY